MWRLRAKKEHVRLLAWNIRQGGGTRLVGIMAAILRHDADVLILSEYRGGEFGRAIVRGAESVGLSLCDEAYPAAATHRRADRSAAAVRRARAGVPARSEPWRLVDVDLGVLRLTGVYMPNLKAKLPYWQTLVAAFAARASGRRAGDRRLQHVPRLCGRARRDRCHGAFHGQHGCDRLLRSMAASVSGWSRVHLVQPPRQRLPHRPCVPVAKSCGACGRHPLFA